VASLLPTYLERRIKQVFPDSELTLLMDWDGEVENRVRSDRALFSLTSSPSRRPDGKPELGNGTPVSFAHGGDLTLVVAGSPGCDLEPVVSRDVQVWCDLLGTNAFAVANVIAQETGESLDVAATRLWTVKECLKKAGVMIDTPLILTEVMPDGGVCLSAGAMGIVTFVVSVQGFGEPVVVAGLVGKEVMRSPSFPNLQ
jgi:enediyne polyketide synthase